MADLADVAIVGGGPAGAALAIRLADAGLSTILFERSAEPKWRPCGVFSSPLTRRRLVELGLSRERVNELSRPISALNLETVDAATCRLLYEHGHACGFDRVQLDAALLDGARRAGAEVQTASVVRSVQLPRTRGELVLLQISPTEPKWDGNQREIKARFVVGAAGPNSRVARDAGIRRKRPWLRNSAITFHRTDPDAPPEGEPMEGRFVFGRGWYVGIAPVPGARVNLGMVLPSPWLMDGLDITSDRLVAAFPGPRERWMSAPITDNYRAAGILEHRVDRVAGDGFALIGDAAGFIDPLTGEGLHRALVSAELAADAIGKWLRGDAQAMEEYDRRLRARFRNKDVVSWLLQAFLAQPAVLGYALRRLGNREQSRKTFTLVMTDQVPASRALDPRFLLRLLAP